MISSENIQNIELFNTQLTTMEEEIYLLAQKENDIAVKKMCQKIDNITDYELELNIVFYKDKDEGELVFFTERMKSHFLHHVHCNINDKANHNVTSATIDNRILNEQKHCWLLHRLYDDCAVSWEDILDINCVWFDVDVRYQYRRDI
jgi:hypothetical protein